jgi:HD-like signal output (HDOD) protein
MDTSPSAAPVDPGEAPAAVADIGSAPEAALEREARLRALLGRLSASPEFPSLRESVRAVQKVTCSERAHLRAVSDEILQDVALSGKVLRVINTAFYRSAGGAEVDSVTRAAAVMGVDAIGRLAASVKLTDRLPAGMRGTRVQAEFARALLAALAAHEFHPSVKEGEAVYLAGMFQNLGRLLMWMHFPDDAQQVEAAARQELLSAAGACEDEACRPGRLSEAEQRHAAQRLGLSYGDIGVEVARLWGWPATMLRALQPMAPGDFRSTHSGEDRVRLVASLANQLADVIIQTPSASLPAALAAFQESWKGYLGEDPKPFQALLQRVERQWSDLAVFTHLADSGAGSRAPSRTPATQAGPGGAAPGWPAFTMAAALQRMHAVPASSSGAGPEAAGVRRAAPRTGVTPAEAAEALTRGAAQLREAIASGCSAGEALQTLMTVMAQALRAQRVAICLRDPVSGQLRGRLGVGLGMPRLLTHFTVDVAGAHDVFGLACAKGLDTLIDDASKPATWRRLPQWYRLHLATRCILLLPLQGDKGCIGMVYADHPGPAGLPVQAEQLSLVQAMRDEVRAVLIRRAQRQGAGAQTDTA